MRFWVCVESEHSVCDKKWKISKIWTKFWGWLLQLLSVPLCLHEVHASEGQFGCRLTLTSDSWLHSVFLSSRNAIKWTTTSHFPPLLALFLFFDLISRFWVSWKNKAVVYLQAYSKWWVVATQVTTEHWHKKDVLLWRDAAQAVKKQVLYSSNQLQRCWTLSFFFFNILSLCCF